jgi:hypothetical protein
VDKGEWRGGEGKAEKQKPNKRREGKEAKKREKRVPLLSPKRKGWKRRTNKRGVVIFHPPSTKKRTSHKPANAQAEVEDKWGWNSPA